MTLKPLLALPLLVISASALAVCPPSFTDQGLFLIQRSKNLNEVHYDACVGPDGALASNHPVDAYWKNIDVQGHTQREDLGGLATMAYGYEVGPTSAGAHPFEIKALKDRHLQIVRVSNRWRVQGTIDGRPAYITHVYVKAHESFFIPKVEFVDVFGEDARTGAQLQERLDPHQVARPEVSGRGRSVEP